METQNNDLALSYVTLRQLIGSIGLLMPITVRVGGYVFQGIWSTNSISAYYYTDMRDVFVATLVLVGVLLICYRGPDRQDNVVSIIAGIAAIGIGLFPTDPSMAKDILQKQIDLSLAPYLQAPTIHMLHIPCVIVFFVLTFYMVFFRFGANTPANPSPEKQRRNLIYKVCGMVMLISFLIIGVLWAVKSGASIFWPEAAAVVAFAVAWLVKGQRFCKDKITRLA